MARATLTTVQRLCYENLNVRTGSYGTLDSTNQRYLTGFIDDNIAIADIETIMILLKEKQSQHLKDLYVTSAALTNSSTVPNNWGVVSVSVNGVKGIEVPEGFYNEIAAGGIYNVTDYQNYYCIIDGAIYSIANSAIITYIDLTHPTTLSALKSPTGLETALADNATAKCLMKRGDRPEEAKYRRDCYDRFMSEFLMKQSPAQQNVER
jgi:hypothetical protein